MRKLCDGVCNNICSITILIPRLRSYEIFRSPEQHGFYDDSFVEFFIELRLVLFPFALNVVTECHKVLLSALTDDVRQIAPCILIFGEVHLRNQLLRWVLKFEEIALSLGEF